ncbi:MAG: signal peptidase II [Acidimicrobiales bacterium]
MSSQGRRGSSQVTKARSRRRVGLVALVAAAVVVVDVVTKDWALSNLSPGRPRHVIGPSNLLLTFNTGTAFSLGRGVTPILEAVVVVAVCALVLFTRRVSAGANAGTLVGLGLLLGGALGNLGDRVFRHIPGYPGGVVDFIQAVRWWPVFNVADSCVVVGVIVLLISYRNPQGRNRD